MSIAIVFTDKYMFIDDDIDLFLLKKAKAFKMLSLVEASRSGIPILPTALCLNYNSNYLNQIMTTLKLPLIIRVDYKNLPKRKVLGGFPLHRNDTVKEVSKFLVREKYYPVYHPFVNRLNNLYSVGILIEPKSNESYLEILGQGFDASDLRLGSSIPHQTLRLYHYEFLKAETISIISPSSYKKERDRRKIKISKMLKYTDFINKNNYLLSSLETFSSDNENQNALLSLIPEEFTPIPENMLKSLIEMTYVLRSDVINKLPDSNNYIVSLSYVDRHEWVLWDIYGEWYYR